MKLKEENDLQNITQYYTNAIQLFQKKEYKKANDAFNKIIEDYQNSEFYSVLEIQTRSKIYKSIIQSQLHPKKIELEGFDDYIWHGVYHLNSGNISEAMKGLQKAESNKDNDPFLHFLLAVVHFKNQDLEQTLQYISSCVKLDSSYKVIIYNEPDFEPLREKTEFLALVE